MTCEEPAPRLPAYSDRALMLLLFDTGLRAAECAALDVGHVDQRSGAVLVLGKGSKSHMACTDPTVVRIRRHLRHYTDATPAVSPTGAYTRS